MKYRITLKITIIFFLLLFGSCASKNRYYAKRVPERIRYIEKDLALNLGMHYIPNVQFYVMCNVIKKKKDIGIYLYKEIGHHQRMSYVFMYDGDTIFYTNIKDSLGMKTFIESNSFPTRKIKKCNERLEIIKRENETVNKRW